jgi:hypothetical protein
MTRYPVHTKNILSVGYDEVNEVLEIELKLKLIYHYLDVPLSEYIALMKADDVEDFYLNYIKLNYHFEIV